MDERLYLKQYFYNGKLPHAVLLENAQEQTAFWLAKAAVCSEADSPCNRCADCRKADMRSHADIVVRRPDRNGRYTIKFVREDILNDAYILPNESAKKVYLIFEADKLSVQCQNALLKTLEEPPEYAVFVLCCSSKENLLETVLSRCVSFTFSEDKIESGEQFAEEAIQLVSDAVFSREITLLGDIAGITKSTELQELAQSVLCVLQNVYSVRILNGSTDDKRLQALVKRMSLPAVLRMIDVTRDFLQRLDSNGNIPLVTTIFCADLKKAL